MSDRLLPLAVSDAEYAQWQAAPAVATAHRAADAGVHAFRGLQLDDEHRLAGLLDASRHRAAQRRRARDGPARAVRARSLRDDHLAPRRQPGRRDRPARSCATPKPYGPPFLMLGLNLENTTSDDFSVTLTARASPTTSSDPGPSCGSTARSVRIPSLGVELYKPIGATPFFVAPYAGIVDRTLSVIADDALVAKYGETLSRIGLNVGMNLGRAERSAPRRLRRPGRRRTSRLAIRGCRRSPARKRWPRRSGATTRRTARSCRPSAPWRRPACATSSTSRRSRRRWRAGARARRSRSWPAR